MSRHDPKRKPKTAEPPRQPYTQNDLIKILGFGAFFLVLVVIVQLFFSSGNEPYEPELVEIPQANESEIPVIPDEEGPVIIRPDNGGDYFEAPDDPLVRTLGNIIEEEDPAEDIPESAIPSIPDMESAPPEQEAQPMPEDTPNMPGMVEPSETETETETENDRSSAAPAGTRGKIAIMIDDVGVNLKQSRASLALPSEVTLAFLPYARDVKELSAQAREEGHELIIHAPMEAINPDMDLGPLALRADMDFAEFDIMFSQIADSFDGYVGVNNHMGSRLTQEPEQMAYLMQQLKKRNLYFLDSRTIHTSIAAEMARAYGIPSLQRDVFLDHEETEAYVTKALSEVERIARKNGYAVAIGHPKEVTMEALNDWIPTLEAKGFELVTLSKVMPAATAGRLANRQDQDAAVSRAR
jgi:polysaccharide deacetylase 2 family uncharacterized protein YibQ